MSAALQGCVAHAIALVGVAVERANARRGRTFDPMSRLYVTEREVDEIIAGALRDDVPLAPLPVIADIECLGLDDVETQIVALCAAAEIVPRFDRVIGFVHDDLTRRTLTTGLALELLCPTVDERGRLLARLEPSSRLQRLALIDVTPDDAPLRTRLSLDRGMLGWLRGRDLIDWRIADVASLLVAPPVKRRAAPGDGHGARRAVDLVGSAGGRSRFRRDGAGRCTYDAGSGSWRRRGLRAHSHRGARSDAGGRIVLVCTDAPPAAAAAARLLDGLAVLCVIAAPSGVSGVSRGAHARVTPRQRSSGSRMPATPLPYGRRIAPRRTLDHLVLPAQRLRAVRSVLRRVRTRDTVQGTWKMRTGSSRGGVRALFAGPPGTGKTLAAEAVSGELGRDLYVITLVDPDDATARTLITDVAAFIAGKDALDDPAIAAWSDPRGARVTRAKRRRLAVRAIRSFAQRLRGFERARCTYILRAILSGPGLVRATAEGWEATFPRSPLRVVLDRAGLLGTVETPWGHPVLRLVCEEAA